MANSTATRNRERPFTPSWIDRFHNWAKKMPVREWIIYVICGTGLILVQMLLLWLEGGLHAEELLPVIFFNGLATPFTLALIHLLDSQAVTALNSMRPILEMSESLLDQFRYEISNMPSRAALIVGLITPLFLILMERLWIAPVRFEALEELPVFAIIFHIIDKSSTFMLVCLSTTPSDNCDWSTPSIRVARASACSTCGRYKPFRNSLRQQRWDWWLVSMDGC